MHCFLCGELAAILSSLEKYDVPICTKCENDDSNSIYYKKFYENQSGFRKNHSIKHALTAIYY